MIGVSSFYSTENKDHLFLNGLGKSGYPLARSLSVRVE